MFVKATGDERMWDYDWAPATINPPAVILGMKQLGVDVSAWTGERTPVPGRPEAFADDRVSSLRGRTGSLSDEMDKPILAVVAVAALVAAVVWGRSAQRMQRVWQRIEDDLGPDADATVLARSSYRKELHTVTLYAVLAVAAAVAAVLDTAEAVYLFAFILVPVGLSVALRARLPARGAPGRGPQPARAPRRGGARRRRSWPRGAGRPASPPRTCPTSPASSSAGCTRPAPVSWPATSTTCSGVAPTRIAAVIGDVTGHGIEPSITAFQAKYLLRVFLRQYRDPAQALEELNRQMSALERVEEFISICVVVFDTEAATLRVRVGRPPGRLAVARPRGAPAARHRSAAHARPRRRVHQPGDPARDRRPAAALHRRPGRGPCRRAALRRGPRRQHPAPRPRRAARRALQDRCSRRPATSPPSR